VGKSTLLNRFVGEKIAASSPKPQTTWNSILGVKTRPDAQILFVDTPGIHEPVTSHNQYMVRALKAAIRDADLILHVVDVQHVPENPGAIIGGLPKARTIPVILVVNKIDVARGNQFGTEDLAAGYCQLAQISALRGDGVADLEREVVRRLPVGPRYFPAEVITDLPERFIVRELIREKIFYLMQREIPYSSAVTVDEFAYQSGDLVRIGATISVERESQKGIVIGKGGKMLREIGRLSRMDLEAFLGKRVYLDLWVRVQKNWSKRDYAVKELGLT
jgi:GTP-binding protein Era